MRFFVHLTAQFQKYIIFYSIPLQKCLCVRVVCITSELRRENNLISQFDVIRKLNSVLKLKKRIGILENKMDEENDVPTNGLRERKASICNNTCKDSLVRARLTEMIALKCEISQLNE